MGFGGFKPEVYLTHTIDKRVGKMVLSTDPRGEHRPTDTALISDSDSVNK